MLGDSAFHVDDAKLAKLCVRIVLDKLGEHLIGELAIGEQIERTLAPLFDPRVLGAEVPTPARARRSAP